MTTCDRCNASSKVTVTAADGGKLDLCGHHFRAHEVALFIQGFTITTDDREDGW